ncbi:tyrosine-type recombinase/integrase [Kitasatospora sp. NPDC086801]|uniref:tyrosine-type recombinase/integrase n=1 Tax=Kitasatospora TaxID=2063 RepID=UPI0038120C81
MWTVVSSDYVIHFEAESYLAVLRSQEDASVNTERTYAGRVALYLSYCHDFGISWAAPTLNELARLLHWLIDEPLPPKGRTVPAEPRHRDKRTANAIINTICQFLRHCSMHGWVSADLVAQLSEPKFLHHLPRGFDPGEDGQYRTVRSQKIKFKVAVPGFEYLTDEEIVQVLSCTTHARDRLLVTLLAETGIRIGEALGLRREDMHLLANSRMLDCKVAGPHIHVRRRQNANGALSKARMPRWLPVTQELAGLYAEYQWERDAVSRADACDMVFVNLFHVPLGEPMKYPSTYELFKRLAKRAGFVARPHMFRHSAATRWIRQGRRRDVVQDLLGHVSPQSMDQYIHASDQEKRDAVEAVTNLRNSK